MITPNQNCPELARKLGVPELWLKREDVHPFLSHKGRSLPFMIDSAMREKADKFVISSSGNAGIASALYIKKLNEAENKISLKIFIGKNIGKNKLKMLEAMADKNISVEKKERPLQEAVLTAKTGWHLLRQSTDNSALPGYFPMAEELLEIKKLKAVFIASSSGASAEGVAKYFVEKGRADIGIHIVQTSSCHPIAKELGAKSDTGEEEILADAIVDKVAHRKPGLSALVRNSEGAGWIAENELIKEAVKILKNENVDVSPNGALAIAGLIKALRFGFVPEGAVACIVGGQ